LLLLRGALNKLLLLGLHDFFHFPVECHSFWNVILEELDLCLALRVILGQLLRVSVVESADKAILGGTGVASQQIGVVLEHANDFLLMLLSFDFFSLLYKGFRDESLVY